MTEALKKKANKQVTSIKPIEADSFIKLLRGADPSQFHSPTEFLKSLNLPSPLLISGSEPLRIKRFVSWFIDSGLANFKFSSTIFFGNELNSKSTFESLLSALGNMSLFAANQLVIIHNINEIKTQWASLLAENIMRFPSTFVIFTLSSEAKAIPLLDKIEIPPTTINLSALKGDNLVRWIKKEAKSLDSDIEDEAATILARAYENDLSTLSQQLLSLSLLSDKTTPITEEFVKKFGIKQAEQTSFELVSHIASGNVLRAHQTTTHLINQGLVPLQINTFLGRAFRMMLVHKVIKEEKLPASNLPQDLSHPWFLRQLSPSLSRMSRSRLEKGVALCSNLDLLLKSSGLPPELALSLTVTNLTQSGSTAFA